MRVFWNFLRLSLERHRNGSIQLYIVQCECVPHFVGFQSRRLGRSRRAVSTALFGLKPSASKAFPNSQIVIYSLLRIINHRIAKGLSFCVLSCLVFCFFLPRSRQASIPPGLYDLQTCRLSSMCRFEKWNVSKTLRCPSQPPNSLEITRARMTNRETARCSLLTHADVHGHASRRALLSK